MKEDKRIELGKRLQNLVHKSTGQSEGVFADGGATVEYGIHPEILSANFAEGTLYADCRHITVAEGNNGIRIPITNETTRSKTNIKGGYRAYVVGEGVEKSANAGSFSVLKMGLNKEAVVIYATDELIQDSTAIAQYINDSAEEAIMALTDDSIIHGNGLMTSITGHPCTGLSAVSNPITLPELHNFFDEYYGGKDGKWYVSKDMYGQILDLFDAPVNAGTGGGSVLLTFSNGVYYIFGYPMVICDTMTNLEMMLADLTQYVIVEKPMTKAVNESLKWLEDEKAFRFVLRLNGNSIWVRPITLADGSEVHPFVISAVMNDSSSSESSSASTSSSSSYIELHSSSSSSSSYVPRWSSSSTSSSKSLSTGSSASTGSSQSNSSMSLSSGSSDSESSESESSISDSDSSGSSESLSSNSTNSSPSSNG